MSQKKVKKKGQDASAAAEEDKPTKTDYSIGNYMLKNVPTKRTKFLHHQVNYFYASKAVDVLLESPWASGKGCMFTDRASVVEYLNRLLTHKFFHRAKKIAVTDRDLKPKHLKKKREKEIKEKEEKVKKEKEKEKAKKKKETSEPKEDEGKEVDEDSTSKKKKKIKLDMHLEQVFVDGPDAYVWMYDPVPFWYYIAGAIVLLAAVAICLFPLWPPGVRKVVYYLSMAAAGFLGVILGLAVLRFVVFIIIWVLSRGRHHLWLLPNLTEDVGFFASFLPLYKYEYRGPDYDRKKKKKKKSAAVEEDEADQKCTDNDGQTDGDGAHTGGQPSDSDNSQPFEMVDQRDLRATDDDDISGDNSDDPTGDEGYSNNEGPTGDEGYSGDQMGTEEEDCSGAEDSEPVEDNKVRKRPNKI